jgi:hypothetical protein
MKRFKFYLIIALGVVILVGSLALNAKRHFIHIQPVMTVGKELLAVLPVTLKVKTSVGITTVPSFWIGVSADGGQEWTFISASFLNDSKLALLFPSAVGKLHLPQPKEPMLQDSAEWVKFSPPEGRFTILLPELPQSVAQKGAEANGQEIPEHVYFALGKDIKDSIFMVMYAEGSAPPVDQQQALDNAIDGMLKEGQGTLLHKENISLDSYLGREIEFSDDSNITQARVYGVERRLYMLLYIRPKGSDAVLASKDAAKFFSSFKLIVNK